jgi:hypothetical protein
MILILVVAFGFMFWAITRDYKPTAAKPVEENPAPVALVAAQKEGIIIVNSPLIDSTVSASPVVIKGRAKGNWFFEASAPVDIVNWDGLIIGEGYVTVDQGYDWMTTDMVPFTGTVSYDAAQLGAYKYGWIIMKKDNPSGEPQFDDSLEFKIFFP